MTFVMFRILLFMEEEDTVKPLYTSIRYNDKIRYNDNLNGMIPYLKMRQIIRDI